MAWTEAENTRVTTLEEAVNDLSTAISNLMTKTQMRQLLLIKQREIDSLGNRVAALEAQVRILQQNLD